MPLDDLDRQQIRKFEARMELALAELRKWQTAINAVHEAADEKPPYDLQDSVRGVEERSVGVGYGRGEFHGKPLATVVKRIIRDQGPMSAHELYEIMEGGGFDFGDSSEGKALHGLKISLGKNRAFTKMPNGFYNIATEGVKRRKTVKRVRIGADKDNDEEEGAHESV